jgi:hypothetical protein
LFELGWLQISGIGFGIVVALVGIVLALTSKVASCPYCSKTVGAGATDSVSGSDEPEHLECDHCFELLVAEQGKVRALNETDVAGKDAIEVMALKDGVWPRECIVCGAPPTRFEEAKVTKPEYASSCSAPFRFSPANSEGSPIATGTAGRWRSISATMRCVWSLAASTWRGATWL